MSRPGVSLPPVTFRCRFFDRTQSRFGGELDSVEAKNAPQVLRQLEAVWNRLSDAHGRLGADRDCAMAITWDGMAAPDDEVSVEFIGGQLPSIAHVWRSPWEEFFTEPPVLAGGIEIFDGAQGIIIFFRGVFRNRVKTGEPSVRDWRAARERANETQIWCYF